MVNPFKEFVKPPYTKGQFAIIIITFFLLLSIPVTVLSLQNLRPQDSRAFTPQPNPKKINCLLGKVASIDNLIQNSTSIVHGIVEQNSPIWENGHIFTESKIKIIESFKQKLPPALAVKTVGGRIGQIGEYLSCEAQLAENEEVVLFLNQKAGRIRVYAGTQGKFQVSSGKAKRIIESTEEFIDLKQLKEKIKSQNIQSFQSQPQKNKNLLKVLTKKLIRQANAFQRLAELMGPPEVIRFRKIYPLNTISTQTLIQPPDKILSLPPEKPLTLGLSNLEQV